MLVWFAETTLVAMILAGSAVLAGRWLRIGPVARHALWLVVLVKLVAPPVVSWPKPAWLAWPSREVARAPVSVDLESTELSDESFAISLDHAPDPPVAAVPSVAPWTPPDLEQVGRGLLGAWGIASALIVIGQIRRVVRSRRLLRWAVPAPCWLVEEAARIGERLGLRPVEILVVPESTTPMLWCLGRPKLILPARLVESLGLDGWRGILAHELAHVRRRDHWVRRLELLAGLLWWWNPIYWLTCRRLDAEAELACDECAVRTFPEGRLAYAEALLEVCRSLSMAEPLVPALGVAGAGQFLERRVTMIVRDQAPCRPSTPALIAAGLLALLALPGWSASGSPLPKSGDSVTSAPNDELNTSAIVQDDDKDDIKYEDDDDKDDDDDDDQSADKDKGRKRKKEKRDDRKKGPDSPEASKADKKSADSAPANERGRRGRKRNADKRMGPDTDFTKDLEGMTGKLAKELEEKLGPGSDFEKKITEKFGPDSEFAKKILEAFGPDSEFQRQMNKMHPDGKPAQEHKKPSDASAASGPDIKPKREPEQPNAGAASPDAKPKADPEARRAARQARSRRQNKERQIRELQSQINRLSKQLKALEKESGDDK